MTKMQSLIPDEKWGGYMSEWSEYEEDYRDGRKFSTHNVDIRGETDELIVLVFPHGTNWFDYYDVDTIDTRVVMESEAKRITGQQFMNTYPVVLPKSGE